MKRLKNITILLCFLSLFAFISCSAEDKTGVKDNPPEDTEITDGETETTETIEAKDFPADLLGYYAHSKTGYPYTQVNSIMNEGVKTTQILASFDNGTDKGARHSILIEKWKKTTKGEKIIKLEGERDKGHGCYTVTFDYETKTISGTYKHTGIDWSFSGTKK